MLEIYPTQFFTYNKYLNWYHRLVQFRLLHPATTDHIEKHHIIPNCFVKSSFVVHLTAREHFICHRLLTRCTHGIHRSKMCWAVFKLMNSVHHKQVDFKVIKTAKEYERIKLFNSQNLVTDPITNLKRSQTMLGRKRRPRTDEEKRKISEGLKGKRLGIKLSVEHRAKISSSNKGVPRTMTDAARQARIATGFKIKGRKYGPQSEERRRNISEGIKRALATKCE